MKSGVGAGPFEDVGSEGFNRAERARGPHAAGGRLARRPGENRRGERVGIPAGQVHHGQVPAARVARHGHHVGADGLGGARGRPAAPHPARRHHPHPPPPPPAPPPGGRAPGRPGGAPRAAPPCVLSYRTCRLHAVRTDLTASGFTVTTVPLTALGRREDGSPKARLVLARTASTP